ncbi:hypothetical protein MRX96_023604 [Rhipicephalus microplus]
MLVSVVVTEDLSVSVYFKCAPLVSDDVCIPDEVRDVCVLDNLLDSVERYSEKKARQQEDKPTPARCRFGSEAYDAGPSTSRDVAVRPERERSFVFAAAGDDAVPAVQSDGESTPGSDTEDPGPSTSRGITVRCEREKSFAAAADDDVVPAVQDVGDRLPQRKRTVQIHLEPRFVSSEGAEKQASSVRDALREVSATERKFGFAQQTEQTSATKEDEFTLIQVSAMNSLIGPALCPKCYSDSDRVKTCQNTSTRVDTQLPPSSSYLNCDSRAKDFEFQRWSELLERARAAEVCMGCDFVNVTNESPKCYTDMASTAQLLYGDILEVTAVTVLTTGTVSSWRLTTSHLRAAWLSQTDDDHVLRAVYSLSTTGPTISARFEISSERQTSSATQASCLMSPHPRGVLCVAQAVEKEDYSRRSRFGTCVSMPRQSVRLRHPISHKLVRRPSLIGAELQHLRLSGKL